MNDRDPFVRCLGSPFKAKQQSKAGTDGVDSTVRNEQQGKSGADSVDLGPSLLQTAAPKPTKAARAEILEKQRALLRVKFMEKKTGSDEATEGEQSGETGKNGMMEQQETEGVRPTKRPEQATNDPDDEDENDLFVNGTAPIDHAKLFRDLERLVSRKRKAGTLTDEDDVEFMRAEAAEQERLNKEIADKKAGIPRNTTPGEAAGTAGEDSEGNFVAPPLEDEAAQAEPVAGKKRGRKSATSREEAAQPKKPRKRARVTDPADDADPDGAATAPGRKKAPKGKAKKYKAPKGRKKKQGPEMTNTANLTGTDVFRDTEQTRNLPDQPTFAGTGVRTEALKQMVASLPAESVKLANVDMRFLKAAIKSFTGNQTVHPAADGNWSVKGMETTLKHYQVLGVAFMRKREMSQKAPQGGILADSMGLGKTLMMLANIMNGRSLQEKACKTTLIVAAPALVAQWAREIDKHVTKAEKSEKHGLDRVQRFHAGIKLGLNNVKKTLEGADIVLTTYSAVCKSYPKVDVPVDCVTAQQKNDWWKEHYEKNRGVLHQIKFHRVVLDEAQAIKNHVSITSRACRAIEATHHWAISGTPIMNNVKEFVSISRARNPFCEACSLY